MIIDSEELREMLKLSSLEFFRRLSGRLSNYAITFQPRPRSYFHAIASVDRELRSPTVNWGKIVRAILSCRGIEFLQLMEKLNDLRASCQLKEFHAIVGSLLRVRKQAYVAQEIKNPLHPGKLSMNRRRSESSFQISIDACLLLIAPDLHLNLMISVRLRSTRCVRLQAWSAWTKV